MNEHQYLLFRWRQETLRADAARCPSASSAHQKLAELFRNRMLETRPSPGEGLKTGPVPIIAKAAVADWALKH